MPLKPKNAEALEFLQLWSTQWVLVAIRPDRKSIKAATFSRDTLTAAGEWIDEYNGKFNMYFHVNSTVTPMTKIAEREDIAAVEWLHIDIDPRVKETVEAARERALSTLGPRLPTGVPPPTVIVFSGGGVQAFWKLQQPIQIGGDLQKTEDAKRYNQQLEILFGADNCHNINRIMRLPGTMNLPDARKLKKGRTPQLAKLLEYHPDFVYPLNMFIPAPALQGPATAGFTNVQGSAAPTAVPRLVSVDELDEWGVPDDTKVIIVQGRHPDKPKQGDNSRSAWVFHVVCSLVRCKVPDETIFGILTDPEFAISESILEAKPDVESYALRQIERAKEEVEDPWLRKLNEQFAVIGNFGGKCRVVEEVMDVALNRSRLTKQAFDDFKNRLMHQQIQVGLNQDGTPRKASVAKWWLSNPHRRQYETLTFAPQQETSRAYNLWKGFAYVSDPNGCCELFLRHLWEDICNENEVYYKYLISWMARAVQQPASPGEVAVVLRGGRGTGKGICAREFGKLFGRHFLQVSNSAHLVGNFNSHLRDVVVLFADEAFYAGDRRHASVLKTLITEETIPIEAKGVDVETAPNYVHLIMASNDSHVIPAGGDERRFFVLDINPAHQQDSTYFRSLVDELDNGGRGALLHYLLTYDLTDFEVRTVPRTAALQEQKLLSLNVDEEWWFQKLQDGKVLPEHDKWETKVEKDAVINDYVENARRFNVQRRGTATSLGKFLHKVMPLLSSRQMVTTTNRVSNDGWAQARRTRAYFYLLPPLAECRAVWCRLYGPEDWAPEQTDLPIENMIPKEPF